MTGVCQDMEVQCQVYNAGYKYCSNLTPSQLMMVRVETWLCCIKLQWLGLGRRPKMQVVHFKATKKNGCIILFLVSLFGCNCRS